MVSFTPFVSNPNGHFGTPAAPVVEAPAVAPAVAPVPVVVETPDDVPVVDAPAAVRPVTKRAVKGKLATVVEMA